MTDKAKLRQACRRTNMPGELHERAIHEASHAVIARKLGVAVQWVEVSSSGGSAACVSAGQEAKALATAERIAAYEKDAIIAVAGWVANCRENLDWTPLDVLTNDPDPDVDIVNIRTSICAVILLQDSKPSVASIVADRSVRRRVRTIWRKLQPRTVALVEQHWPAIQRVGTHLERHRRYRLSGGA